MLDNGKHREAMVSRRKFLLVSGSVVTGGLAGCIGTARGQTEVEMGSLDIDGDSATLDTEPESIAIDVSGEFSVDSNTTPEQCQITLQCHVGDDALVDDIAKEVYFDTVAGSYEISGELLDHRDVVKSDFQAPIGETITVPLLVRIILSVVVDGSIVAESFVESKAPLEVTAKGIEAQIGGRGSVEIV